MFTAGDFMSSPVIMTSADVSVAHAVSEMRQHRISSLLVRPLADGEPYGIVTKRDVVLKVVAQGIEPQSICVAEIMSKPVVCIPPTYTLPECSRLMSSAGFRRLPIFADGQPIGILSDTDIFAAVEEAGWGPYQQVDTQAEAREATRARLAAKLNGLVPFPEALAESILVELGH